MIKIHLSAVVACTVGLALAGHAIAGVVISTNFDEWSAQTGGFTTIDFIGLEYNSPITTQYESLGVGFVNTKAWSSGFLFPQDGFGMKELNLNGPAPEIYFATPITAIGFHKAPSTDAFLFYLGDEVVSGPWLFAGRFVGFTFETPIDRIFIASGIGTVNIDNIYFGAPIPGPGGLVVIALAGLVAQHRRRRE